MAERFFWSYLIVMGVGYILALLMNAKFVLPSLVKENIENKDSGKWRLFVILGIIVGIISFSLELYSTFIAFNNWLHWVIRGSGFTLLIGAAMILYYVNKWFIGKYKYN
jgi:hypothetical protein